MTDEQFESLQSALREAARSFPYPPTPDIAGAVGEWFTHARRQAHLRPRRLAVAIAIVVVLIAGLLMVPQVRAGILDVLRLGAVRILLTEPATPTAPVTAPATAPVTSTARSSLSPTPSPAPTRLSSVLDLAGEMSFADAQSQVKFPLRTPAYPPDLGAPDAVFLQRLNGPVVVLVWLDNTTPSRVRLSLHLLGPGAIIDKVKPRVIQETTVRGQRALWTEGPYLIQQRDGDYSIRRLIDGHVLIWQEGEITYRLETGAPLDEAVKIAESLR
jgi:hypothetical protein